MKDERLQKWDELTMRYLTRGEGKDELLALDKQLREAGLLPALEPKRPMEKTVNSMENK